MLIIKTYPNISEIVPITIPVRNICDVFISPVEYAIAFGGVLIGNDIAKDADIATPISNVPTPPYTPRDGPMPLPTATMIGTMSAVAAEFDIN